MNNEDDGMLRELTMKWAAPSGILITVGLVIWLIQLNANALRNAEEIGALKASQGVVVQEMRAFGLTIQRTTILQDTLYEQVDVISDKLERLEIRSYVNDHNHEPNPNTNH